MPTISSTQVLVKLRATPVAVTLKFPKNEVNIEIQNMTANTYHVISFSTYVKLFHDDLDFVISL